MEKKWILAIVTLVFMSNIQVFAENCVTGYACSIDSLKQQDSVNKKIPVTREQKHQNLHRAKAKNRDGIFVDGKEYNKPEYTEVFTKYDLFNY